MLAASSKIDALRSAACIAAGGCLYLALMPEIMLPFVFPGYGCDLIILV